MQIMILAGGKGTRISEESHLRPKPMIEIGGKPILWHIMKNYSHYGFNDFIICLGYRGYMIKEYFMNYCAHKSDICVNVQSGITKFMDKVKGNIEPWNVSLIETGEESTTGERIRIASKYVVENEFMMTYGDGVGDINIKELLKEHKKGKKLVTITTMQAKGRFGSLQVDKHNNVISFAEKKDNKDILINGGYFIIDTKALKYINHGEMWEAGPIERLVAHKQLHAYHHEGFWQAMDTLRDKNYLEELWQTGIPAWKIW